MDTQYHSSNNYNARVNLHRLFATNKHGWHQWIFDHFDFPDECRILELGCATGNLWSQNLQRIRPGWRLTLSDLSAGMVEEATRNLAALAGQAAFAIVDAQEIPFADDVFDVVIANHMLYHVPDMPRGLAEIQRVLCSDGRLFASTVGLTHIQEIGDLLQQTDPAIDSPLFHRDTSFTLENGEARLAPWFTDIRLVRYPDALAVTEVEPLVAYVQSLQGNCTSLLVGDRLAWFRQRVQRQIDACGAFHIRKSEGMFMAVAAH